MTIDERVIALLRKALLLNDVQITTTDTHLIHDLSVTSLDRFELLMSIEEEFGIELTGEEQESIYTVGDVIERVKVHCPSLSAPIIANP
ncbi:MAG TPA: phosphopantetheine-binding protein [Rhizomicrobium sp.]|jgi:acyl carrier protein